MNTFQSSIVYGEERLLYPVHLLSLQERHAELTRGYTGAQK